MEDSIDIVFQGLGIEGRAVLELHIITQVEGSLIIVAFTDGVSLNNLVGILSTLRIEVQQPKNENTSDVN